MLAGLRLTLPDGRVVEPLHAAPWLDEPALPGLPGIMRGLQGDFVCVPFGTGDPSPLPPRWQAMGVAAPQIDPPHGFGANGMWQVTRDGAALCATIDYPDADPIARLSRRMTPLAGGRVNMAVTITPRRDCSLPIALHPIFRLGADTRLRPGAHGPVWTHPCGSGVDPCPLLPDAVAEGLHDLPGRDGTTLDFTRLPRTEPCESRLLITQTDGRFTLDHHAEGWSVTLEWDATLLPSLMLWVSNRGRSHAPWNGRHLALGVEPCIAAFDLGAVASAAPSPLTDAGVRTVMNLAADTPVVIRYALSVAPLG